MSFDLDVAIIGGGPGGSTCGGMLKKYAPDLSVGIFERETFPRDHVGESALPPISQILNELGCWDEVEAAGFPIKIGATYRWGSSDKLWDFEFMPVESYQEQERPRSWNSQAKQLALQVERATYDNILLNHAARLGCVVRQNAQVRKVERNGDQVDALVLADGSKITARWYIDASGSSAILRRAMGVKIDVPTSLQNIAIWDYWENTEWASRFPGGATRALIMSIGSGWIWFIPLGPGRTSIGYVCPRQFFKEKGLSTDEIYRWALEQEPLITELTEDGKRSGKVQATKDWSFVAERVTGKNWFLVGETAGFADPILAAGMTLTQTSAREAAYSILAIVQKQHDANWLKQQYDDNQRTRIRQHIRFADFWYSANGIFTDLQEQTQKIAKEAGLDLDPKKAFQWLGSGDFTHDVLGQVGIGSLDLAGARQIAQRFVGGQADWQVSKFNRFFLNLKNCQKRHTPAYQDGKIQRIKTYVRGNKRLPACGLFAVVIKALRNGPDITGHILPAFQQYARQNGGMDDQLVLHHLLQALELMVTEKWVRAEKDPTRPSISLSTPDEGHIVHTNEDLNQRLARDD